MKKRLFNVSMVLVFLTVTLCFAGEKVPGKYSIIIIHIKNVGYAGEVVPDKEVRGLKKAVNVDFKKAQAAWKEAKKAAKKDKLEFDTPPPPKPDFNVYRKGLSRGEADSQAKMLRAMAPVKVIDLKDAYKRWLAPEKETLRKPEKPTGPHLKVLTYNVNWGLPAPGKTIRAILDSKADMVFLQETNARWEELFSSELIAKYPYSLYRHPEKGAAGGGFAVLSKHKVTEKELIPAQGGLFRGWLLEANSPIGKIQVLNLHLQPGTFSKGRPAAGDFAVMRKTHLKEVKGYFKSLKKDTPTIVLGDFNEGDGKKKDKALEWVGEQGLTNALPEFDSKTVTWKWKHGTLSLEARYDHVFYSKHFRSLDALVIKKGGSDHFPVLVVLEKTKKKK